MHIQYAAALAVFVTLAAAAFGSSASGQEQPSTVSANVSSLLVSDEPIVQAPLSARITTRTVQQLYDGNRLVHETEVLLFRDSSGRVRREMVAKGSSLPRSVTISDPVAGEILTLRPDTKSAFRLAGSMGTAHFGSNYTVSFSGYATPVDRTAEVNVAGVASATTRTGIVIGQSDGSATLVGSFGDGRAGPDVTLESLGEAEIGGVRATGDRRTTTYPAGALGNELPLVVTKETWYSPELQIVVRSEERDPRFGTISYSVEVLGTAEPDVSLFELPQDYSLSTPMIDWPPVAD